MTKAPDRIVTYLGLNGPALSSVLARHISASTGVSAQTARKQIERARSPVQKLKEPRFARREQLLYLHADRGGPKFLRALNAAFEETGAIHGSGLNALVARGGACPTWLAPTFLGAPTSLKGQVSAATVLRHLEDLGFLVREDIHGLGECVRFAPTSGFPTAPPPAIHARNVAETVLVGAVRDWLRKLNFASWGATSERTEGRLPEFSKYNFDVVGPSYVLPIARTPRRGGNGFVVADVIAGSGLSLANIEYFFRKTDTIRNLRRVRPFMAFLVCDSFTPEAQAQCKGRGLVLTTPRELFGDDVAQSLADLIATLTDITTAARDPDVACKLFSKLGKMEGAAANLRGPLFELIVAHLLRQERPGEVSVGRQVTSPEGKADIDVLLTQKAVVAACECRGHAPGHRVGSTAVKDWLERQVPRMSTWLRGRAETQHAKLSFEYWTTGSFTDEALEVLTARQAQTKQYAIAWFDGAAILEKARHAQEARIVETLQEQYLRHPLGS